MITGTINTTTGDTSTKEKSSRTPPSTPGMAALGVFLFRLREIDFVEDALGEFVDGWAGAIAAVDGVAGDAGEGEFGLLAVLIGNGDLHGRLGQLRRNRRGRIVVDLVGLIVLKLIDQIRARRRRGFRIGCD